MEVHTGAEFGVVYVDAAGRASSLLRSPAPIWIVQSRDGTNVAYPWTTAKNRNVWFGEVPAKVVRD